MRANEGLSFVQIFGMREGESCRTFIDDYLAQIRSDLARFEGFAEILSFGEEATVAGVPTRSITVNPRVFMEAAGEADAEAGQVLDLVYGEEGMAFHLANKGGLLFAVSGKDGQTRLRDLIAGRGEEGGPGVTAAAFHPIPIGPGFFQLIDIGRFLEGLASTLPEEARKDEAFAAVAEALTGPAGRITTALRFDPAGLTFDLAIPLEAIEIAAGLAVQSQSPEPESPEPQSPEPKTSKP
jgi:hypothetical protein